MLKAVFVELSVDTDERMIPFASSLLLFTSTEREVKDVLTLMKKSSVRLEKKSSASS